MRAWIVAMATACGLAGCSGGLDWRQFRPDGWSLEVAMPCRPVRQERPIELPGGQRVWTTLSCSAQGHAFALGSADLGDPALVPAALAVLHRSARAGAAGRWESMGAAAVPGMTPQPEALRFRVRSQSPQGQPIMGDGVVFARGARIYQVTVLGPQPDSAALRPVFDALKVVAP